MEVNDNAGGLTERVVWTFFASKLAPTFDLCRAEILSACATTR
jgi:hypothetical protein